MASDRGGSCKQLWWALLLASVAWWFLVPWASKVGSIWDARANPTHNVEVRFKGGQVAQGALTRDWRGNYVLTSAGEIHVFGVEDFAVLSVPAPRRDDGDGPYLVAHWRALLPVALISSAYLVALLSAWAAFAAGRQTKEGPSS